MTGIRTSGGFKAISRFSVRTAAGLRQASKVSIRTSGDLKQVSGIGSFVATASPPQVSGYGASHGPIYITTPYASVSVEGGVPPYTYLWDCVDSNWDPISPTSSATQFRSPLVNASDGAATTCYCTVTDSAGNSVDSNNIDADVTNYGT